MSKKKFFMGVCFFLILNLALLSGLSFAQRVTGPTCDRKDNW
jgi:hypothetical protein